MAFQLLRLGSSWLNSMAHSSQDNIVFIINYFIESRV
jgi:hypothetical protein